MLGLADSQHKSRSLADGEVARVTDVLKESMLKLGRDGRVK